MTSQEALMLRKNAGLNQDVFWGRIGVTQSGGSRYESGRKIPKPVRRLLTLVYGSEEAALNELAQLRGGKFTIRIDGPEGSREIVIRHQGG